MTDSSNTSIASIFQGSKIPQYQPPNLPMSSVTNLVPVEAPPEEASQDFEYSRKTTIDTMEVAKKALADLSNLASQSQHPKIYEQLTILMQFLVNSSGTLLHLQRQNQGNRESKGGPGAPASGTTNNLFVGSTAELAGIIANMKKNDGTN